MGLIVRCRYGFGGINCFDFLCKGLVYHLSPKARPANQFIVTIIKKVFYFLLKGLNLGVHACNSNVMEFIFNSLGHNVVSYF